MKHLWYLYPKIVSDQKVEEIVKFGLSENFWDGTLKVNNDDKDYKEYEDKTFRRSKVSFLDRYQHSEIYDLVYNFVCEANNKAFGFDINRLETLQFTLYNEKDKGHYDWHPDTNWVEDEPSQRKLSIIMQLSNPSEYEGGAFELTDADFTKQDKFNLQQKGSVLIFPSFIKHRVTPVTKGERKSLVGWIEGPSFR